MKLGNRRQFVPFFRAFTLITNHNSFQTAHVSIYLLRMVEKALKI